MKRRWAAAVTVALGAALAADTRSASGAAIRVGSVLGEMAPALAVLGALGFLTVKRTRALHERTLTWPVVTGTITAAYVKARKVTSANIGRNLSTMKYHEPVIGYTYEVNGRRFKGTQLRIGGRQLEQERAIAETLVAPYAVGQAVPVHYDPAKPEESILDLAMPRWSTPWLYLSILSGGLGVLGWMLRYFR
jgi:hypothetical protein